MKENTTLQDKMIDDLKTKVLELTRDNEKLLYDRENLSNIIGNDKIIYFKI